MKIRTISAGINLKPDGFEKQIEFVGKFVNEMKKRFINEGFTVQTVRLVTQPWQRFCSGRDIGRFAAKIEECAISEKIDFVSLGKVDDASLIPFSRDIISNTKSVFCFTEGLRGESINYSLLKESGKLISQLSQLGKDGFGNLRFTVGFRIPANGAFFPAAFHNGVNSFSIGTENSGEVYEAFSKSGNIDEGKKELYKSLFQKYSQIIRIANEAGSGSGYAFNGIDLSIAPSVDKDESIAYACEELTGAIFGSPGTLSAVKAITDVLRDIDLPRCGYCGLMLPVLEDYGLAKRNAESEFSIQNLLFYSSVCGTGLDTIPLPGYITEQEIFNILSDTASLSQKLRKPLSARLMPIPGKSDGDMTEYDFEYFVNTRVLSQFY